MPVGARRCVRQPLLLVVRHMLGRRRHRRCVCLDCVHQAPQRRGPRVAARRRLPCRPVSLSPPAPPPRVAATPAVEITPAPASSSAATTLRPTASASPGGPTSARMLLVLPRPGKRSLQRVAALPIAGVALIAAQDHAVQGCLGSLRGGAVLETDVAEIRLLLGLAHGLWVGHMHDSPERLTQRPELVGVPVWGQVSHQHRGHMLQRLLAGRLAGPLRLDAAGTDATQAEAPPGEGVHGEHGGGVGGEAHNGVALALVPRRRGGVQRHLDLLHAPQLKERSVQDKWGQCRVRDWMQSKRSHMPALASTRRSTRRPAIPWETCSAERATAGTCQGVDVRGGRHRAGTHAPGDEQPRVGLRPHDAHGTATHFYAVQVLDSRLCTGVRVVEHSRMRHAMPAAASPWLTPHRRSAQTQSLCRRQSPCLASCEPAWRGGGCEKQPTCKWPPWRTSAMSPATENVAITSSSVASGGRPPTNTSVTACAVVRSHEVNRERAGGAAWLYEQRSCRARVAPVVLKSRAPWAQPAGRGFACSAVATGG